MKNSDYRILARQVVAVTFTIRSLEDALIKARCELSQTIAEIDTNLACDGFKKLFTDLPGSDGSCSETNQPHERSDDHVSPQTAPPQQKSSLLVVGPGENLSEEIEESSSIHVENRSPLPLRVSWQSLGETPPDPRP